MPSVFLSFSSLHSGDGPAPHPGQFTPCTLWVGDWDRIKWSSGCGGESKTLSLHWILTWYPGQSLVPIQTDLFGVKHHACLGS